MTEFMVVKNGRERSMMSFVDFDAFMSWVRTQGEVKLIAPEEWQEPMHIEVTKWRQAAA